MGPGAGSGAGPGACLGDLAQREAPEQIQGSSREGPGELSKSEYWVGKGKEGSEVGNFLLQGWAQGVCPGRGRGPLSRERQLHQRHTKTESQKHVKVLELKSDLPTLTASFGPSRNWSLAETEVGLNLTQTRSEFQTED